MEDDDRGGSSCWGYLLIIMNTTLSVLTTFFTLDPGLLILFSRVLSSCEYPFVKPDVVIPTRCSYLKSARHVQDVFVWQLTRIAKRRKCTWSYCVIKTPVANWWHNGMDKLYICVLRTRLSVLLCTAYIYFSFNKLCEPRVCVCVFVYIFKLYRWIYSVVRFLCSKHKGLDLYYVQPFLQ